MIKQLIDSRYKIQSKLIIAKPNCKKMLFENSISFSINTTSKSSQEESLSPEMKVSTTF